MERTRVRETHRRIREEIRHAEQQRTCCPLSFCRSPNHKSIETCNHPDRMYFVEYFHGVILQLFREEIQKTRELNPYIEFMKNTYFLEETIDDEKLEILLFRLSISPLITWRKTRTEKINIVLNKYRRLAEWNDNENEPSVYLEMDDDEMTTTVMPTDMDVDTEPTPTTSFPIQEEYADEIYAMDTTGTFQIREIRTSEEEPQGTSSITVFYNNTIEVLPPPTDQPSKYLTDTQENLLECPICYETECFITTNCQHAFCECLFQHIVCTQTTNQPTTTTKCPCCRTPLHQLQISHKKHFKLIAALSPNTNGLLYTAQP